MQVATACTFLHAAYVKCILASFLLETLVGSKKKGKVYAFQRW
jgi:hypothetical protein